MNTIMAIAIGCSYSGPQLREAARTATVWDLINPRYYFRSVGWYLPFHDRIRQEPSYWREKHPPEASYVRHMKDAGRGRLL